MQTGDLILLVAHGKDDTWNPSSPMEVNPNPPLGFLASTCFYEFTDETQYMNQVAQLEEFREPNCLEPKHLNACVFRVEAVVNTEDILRAKMIQQLHNIDNETFGGYGREVKYGQNIQLVHESSGQTLRIHVNERGSIAFSMKAAFVNMDIAKEEYPADFYREIWFDSWLQIQAPVHTRSLGDEVLYGDHIHLRMDRWKRYLHVDQSQSKNVEISFKKNQWSIMPFRSYKTALPAVMPIAGGSMYRIFHMEVEGFLFYQPNHHTALTDDKKDDMGNRSLCLKLPNTRKDQEDIRDTSSNSLWTIEALSAQWGGAPLMDGARVRFRHCATDMLLQGCESKKERVTLSLIQDDGGTSASAPTIFVLHNAKIGQMSTLTAEHRVYIQHEPTKTWLHGRKKDQTTRSSYTKSLKECQLVCTFRRQEADIFAFAQPHDVEQSRLFHVKTSWLSAQHHLAKLTHRIDTTGRDKIQSSDTIPISAIFKNLRESMSSNLDPRNNQGNLSSAVGFALHPFSLSKSQHYQQLLREHGIITKLLFSMQQRLSMDDQSCEAVANGKRSHSTSSEERELCLQLIEEELQNHKNPVLRSIQHDFFQLVTKFVEDCAKNQLLLEPYVTLFERMIVVVKSAAEALTETIKGNKKYLFGIRRHQIVRILYSIEAAGQVPEYLRYLEILCEKDGNPVRQNQLLIFEELFQNCPQLIPRHRIAQDSLEIEICIPYVRPDTWKPLSKIDNPNELSYINQAYHLIARLCQGRHTLAQEFISNNTELNFSFEMLSNVLKDVHNQPKEYTASICDMLVNIYIDREPFVIESGVQLTRSWDMPSKNLRVSPPDSGANENGTDLTPLVEFVMEYLMDTEEKTNQRKALSFLRSRTAKKKFYSLVKDASRTPPVSVCESNATEYSAYSAFSESTNFTSSDNIDFELLISVLYLVKCLVAFGQFGTIEQVRILFKALVGVLNGTTCSPKRCGESLSNEENAAAEKLNTGQYFSLRCVSSNRVALVKVKQEVCNILNMLFTIRQNSQLTSLLLHIQNECMREGHLPLLSSESKMRDDHAAVEVLELNYNISEVNLELAFTKIIDDNCIENLPNFEALLLNLVLHGNDRLTGLATSLLNQYFHQTSLLLQSTSKLQLLADATSVKTYQELSWKHFNLQGLLHSTRTIEERKLVIQWLRSLRNKLRINHRANGKRLQRLIRNLGIHTTLTSLLRELAAESGNSDSDIADKGIVLRLKLSELSLCYQILEFLLHGDDDFKVYLFSHIDLLIAHLPKHPIYASGLVRGILNGNRELVASVQSHQVTKIVKVLSANPKELPPSRILDVLHRLVRCNNEPVTQNQNTVLKALMTQCPTNTLRLYASAEAFEARAALMTSVDQNMRYLLDADDETFSNALSYCTPESQADGTKLASEMEGDCTSIFNAEELRYHIRLLQLLSSCAAGKNHLAEVQCRSMLDLATTIKGILDPRTLLPLKKALFGYLDAIFLDVQVRVPNINRSHLVWSVFNDSAKSINNLVLTEISDTVEKLQLEDFITAFICPMLCKYFMASFNTKQRSWTPDEEHYLTCQRLLNSIFGAMDSRKTSENVKLHLLELASLMLESDPEIDKMDAKSFSVPTSPRLQAISAGPPELSNPMSPSRRLALKKRKFDFGFVENDRNGGPLTTRDSLSLESETTARQLEDQVGLHARELLSSMRSTTGYENKFVDQSKKVLVLLRNVKMDKVVHEVIHHLNCSATKSASQSSCSSQCLVAEIKLIRSIVEGNSDTDVYYAFNNKHSRLSESEEYRQQCRLSRLGASVMVLKLIATNVGTSLKIFNEGLLLGLALLRNGNKEVQRAMHQHLESTSLDEAFFSGLVQFLRNIVLKGKLEKQESMARKARSNSSFSVSRKRIDSYSFNNNVGFNMAPLSAVSRSDEDSDSVNSGDREDRHSQEAKQAMLCCVLEFLRLLCEDHFRPMQDYLRVQPDNFRSHNVVDEVASHLRSIQWVIEPRTNLSIWNIDASQIDVACQLVYTLIEFAQGCPENQMLLSTSKTCNIVNDILTQDYVQAERDDFLECATSNALLRGHCDRKASELQHLAVLLLYSLLEGCGNTLVAHNILRYIDIDSFAAFADNLKKICISYRDIASHIKSSCMEENPTTEIDLGEGFDALGGYFAFVYSQQKTDFLRNLVLDLTISRSCDQATFLQACTQESEKYYETCSLAYMTVQILVNKASAANTTSKLLKMSRKLEIAFRHVSSWAELKLRTGCVEIIRDGELQKLLFPIPPNCLQYWEAPSTRESRHRMKHVFAKENQVDKLEWFHSYGSLLLDEINYCKRIDESPTMKLIARGETLWLLWTFRLSIIINILNVCIVVMYSRGPLHNVGFLHIVTAALCIVHFILSLARFLAYVISRREKVLSEYKLTQSMSKSSQLARASCNVIDSRIKKVSNKAAIHSYDLIRHRILVLGEFLFKSRTMADDMDRMKSKTLVSEVANTDVEDESLSSDSIFSKTSEVLVLLLSAKYNLVYLLASGFGITCSFSYGQGDGWRLVVYAAMLLDICARNPTLSNVLAVMRQNRASLIQTFFLVLVIVYIYATIGFVAFSSSYIVDDQGNYGCQTFFDCLITHFNYGLREDNGIAVFFQPIDVRQESLHAVGRMIYDVSYWLIVSLLLLNIISGIITDTFGELRDLRSTIEREMETKCFICGIDSAQFQRFGNGFESHVRREHNMWQYVFLRQYLEDKDKAEFTSQESYVWSMLKAGSTAYYPVGKAQCLETTS